MYDYPAPNAQKVRIFAHEKNISIEYIPVDLIKHELRTSEMLKKNPLGTVPFLELDDGTVISETISICRYLESIYPNPSLFGENSKDEAIIDMWNRRIELDGFLPLLHSVRNKTSFFAGKVVPGTRNKIKQSPELVIRGIEMFKILLYRIDPYLEHNQFISGEKFSIADITGHFMLHLSKILKIDLKKEYVNVFRWQMELEKRTSNPINNLM